jgi:hypothetical protein
MRAYRIFAMVAVLATIGSFVLDLWTAIHSDKGSEPSNAADGQSLKASGGPASIKPTASDAPTACDLRFYEPIRRKLRGERSRSQAQGAERFERLGESSSHIYIYDHATDRLFCVPQSQPVGPIVLGSHTEADQPHRREVIFWCVVVILLATLGLVAINAAKPRKYR